MEFFPRASQIYVVDPYWINVFFTADAELTPVLRLGAGACAGIIAMSATYPMDMVRGRLTVQVGDTCLFMLPDYCFVI